MHGFMAYNAAACAGSSSEIMWFIACVRFSGTVDEAEDGAEGNEVVVFWPSGVLNSAQYVQSAVLTLRVMMALALIMTFPSVAAIGQREAYRVMEPQLFCLGLSFAGGNCIIQCVARSFEA